MKHCRMRVSDLTMLMLSYYCGMMATKRCIIGRIWLIAFNGSAHWKCLICTCVADSHVMSKYHLDIAIVPHLLLSVIVVVD